MSGYLFDTNALVWALLGDPRMGPSTREILGTKDRFVSQVCAIEIAIKLSVGRLNLPELFGADFARAFSGAAHDLSASILSVEMDDISRLSRLPLLHRDPFDRLIIAQALSRGLTVVTGDRAFAAYAGLDVLEI